MRLPYGLSVVFVSTVLCFFLIAAGFPQKAHAQAVGAVAGQHNVGNDGGAQYSIPVSVPAGIQGMQPDIALTYNSNGGNDVVGMGFDIAGLSSIHRCETSIVRDGFRDGVDFDDNDQFCLDGQRLIAVNGLYGANGTEYRTEFDSITKVVSYGSEGTAMETGSGLVGYSATNPQWFKVWTADGRIHDYGVANNSRSTRAVIFKSCPAGYLFLSDGFFGETCLPTAGGSSVAPTTFSENRTYEWSIAQSVDRFSNRIQYTYLDDDVNGEYRIDRIDYNYASGTARNSVRFTYEARPDTVAGFYAGAPFRRTQRLKTVASYAANTKLRELQLTYGVNAATGVSRLTSITECAGGQCVAPSTFTWQPGQAGFASAAINSGNSAAGWDKNPLVMDVNGDGKQDLVQVNGSIWSIMLSTGSQFTTQVNSSGSSANHSHAKVFRYDNDLLDDILTVINGRWYVLRGTVTQPQTVTFTYLGQTYHIEIPGGPNFISVDTGIAAHNPATAKLMDIDGDGRKDLVYVRSGVTYVRFLGASGFGAEQATNLSELAGLYSSVWVMDINGDGQDDLLVKVNEPHFGLSGWNTYVSQGTSQFKKRGGPLPMDFLGSIKVIDFNGDGLADLLSRDYDGPSGTWRIRVWLNKGGTFSPPVIVHSDIGVDAWLQSIPFDYNADGRTDLLYASGGTWRVLVSNGSTVTNVNTGIASTGWNQRPLVADISGNGMDDLVLNIGNTWQTRPHNNLRPDYLTQVQNGMGVQTRFTYRFLNDPTDPDFYDLGTAATYPLINIQNASYLVSKVEQSNGLAGSGMNSTSYRYKRLLMHQQGLGNLGFEQITSINNDTNIRTVATFSHDYATQRHGTLGRLTTTNLTNNAVLSDTLNTWDVVTMGSGTQRRYVRGVKATTVTKRDLNGAFLHKEEVTNPTPHEIYYLGNATTRTQTNRVYGASNNLLRTTTTTFLYTNNPSSWLMGQLMTSTVTSTLAGGSPAPSRSTGFVYDTTTGRKMAEFVRRHSSGADIQRTSFGLNASGQTSVDSFGHNLAVTVSGPDFVSRTSRVIYDSTGRYVTSEINPLNQTTTHTYFADTSVNAGLLQESTDPNGHKTRYTYDPFGRVLTATALYGTANAVTTTTSYLGCAGASPACPANTAYYVRVVGADGGESRTYIDKLGRTLRQATLGFSSGEWIKVDYQYNVRGHNTHVSEPYITGSPLWTTITYDVLGRPTQTVDANARTDTVVYNGLATTYRVDTAGKNQQKIELRDSLGNLIRVTDHLGQAVNYVHDAYGQMTTLTPPAVSGLTVPATTIVYDELGRKISMVDPDKGTWHYTYNMLGELITQKDAKNQVTCMAYDLLGRQIKRADLYTGTVSTSIAQASQSTNGCTGHNAAHTASWVYDTASGAAKGQLHQATGPNGYSQTLIYDAFSRNTQVTETIAGSSYVTNMSYDTKNRLDVLTYPGPSNRLAVKHLYNAQGYLTHLRNNATNSLYYQANQMDARGNVISEGHGNGLTTIRVYNAATGYLAELRTGTALSTLKNDRQNLTFAFDKLGNLTARTDTLKAFTETFSYDGLNRLTGTSANFGNGQLQITALTYDALGNIRTKTGVGTYQYGSQCGAGNRVHAVCQITGGSIGLKNASYSYDANGSMTAGDGRTVTWSAFDKPLVISQGGNSSTMTYGPGRQLLTKVENNAGYTTGTVYVGGLYEKVTLPDGSVEERHSVGGNTLVTYTNRTTASAGTLKTRYLLKDHLGSITAITNEAGNEVESFSFDPWGKRRAATLTQLQNLLGSWSTLNTYEKGNLTIPALSLASLTTDRGFTGHRQMDGVGLIHMGGRVYDAEIGRFLSADPFVRDLTNLQALNRYTYVENNPLSYTDPSGYFLKKLVKGIGKAIGKLVDGIGNAIKVGLQKIGRAFGEVPGLAAAIGAAICGPAAGACWATFTKVMTGLNTAIALSNGGTIGQVLQGAAIGMISNQVGGGLMGVFGDGMGAQAGVSMFMGGAVARAQGGKFIDGVKGAGIEFGVNYGIARIAMAGDGVANAQERCSGQMCRGAGGLSSADRHYARNAENDAYLREAGLYGRNDLTLGEIDMAGEFGFKQAADSENAFHRNGPGNERNIKFTTRVANRESWYQRNFSNRYGRYELIVRPNIDGTFTHVTESINMGTLNRGNNPFTHLTRDVFPYLRFGNTPE